MSAQRDVLELQAAFAAPAGRRLPRLLSRREARVALRLEAGRQARAGEVARIAGRGWLDGVRQRGAELDLAPVSAELSPYRADRPGLEIGDAPTATVVIRCASARRSAAWRQFLTREGAGEAYRSRAACEVVARVPVALAERLSTFAAGRVGDAAAVGWVRWTEVGWPPVAEAVLAIQRRCAALDLSYPPEAGGLSVAQWIARRERRLAEGRAEGARAERQVAEIRAARTAERYWAAQRPWWPNRAAALAEDAAVAAWRVS